MTVRHALAAASVSGILAAAMLTGCGSDGASSSSTTTAATPGPPSGAPALSGEQRAQFSRLRSCLKKQGVDLPEGGPQAGGGPPQIDPAAIQACSKYLPQGGPPGMGAPPGSSS